MKTGKMLLLAAVLVMGTCLQIALGVRDHVTLSIGDSGCRALDRRFGGPSFTFEDQAQVDLPAGATLRLENGFGAVKVRAGQPGRARVQLRKVVFLGDEARAREMSGKVRLSAALDGSELRVRTNRDELTRGTFSEAGLETHFDVELPPGTPVTLTNEHGAVELLDVASAQVEASFDSVRVERVAGEARLKVRHGDVTVVGVGGALTLESRHGDVEVRDAGGRVALDVEHGDVSLQGAGASEVALRHGDLKAERLRGDLRVRAEHAGVEAGQVEGAADVETSFRDVTLRGVTGDVRVVGDHAAVEVEDAGAALYAKATFNDVKLTRVKGHVEVNVEHGGVSGEGLEAGAVVRASGDAVTLDAFSGAVQVDAQRGDVTLTPKGPLTQGLAATVQNGALTLVVPSGSRGRVDAQAEHGEVTSSDLPTLRASTDPANKVEGQLGEGGAAITLRTHHGDIRLEGRAALASGADH